jgi:tetratricopeptide (TPR) repeat protein
MKWLAIAALLIATRAAAQTVDDHLAKVRELYDKGDFGKARDELLAAYQLDARPELLFALGQVELNLGHFDQAIEYYERFIATGPGAEQAALAEQAIGAARDRLAEKPAVGSPPRPPPPRPPPHRVWDFADSGLAAVGGATLLTGAGLLIYGLQSAGDHSGTLSAYDHRISRSETTQWIGAGCLAAGAIAIGSAVLRWRSHLVEAELQPIAAPGTAGVSWVRRW